ncbi:phage baseplate assembly protein V [Celerinatantimonas sp. MCCC 1A17872]|uniref:phage baseplate assembly protein V n=1 Tax=Celerinatantimonas sp. MCCC 1A17872 TaxID=3177514 RepID=UPI0038CA5CB9
MSDEQQILRDIQRRLSNLIRKGRIQSVDFTQTPPRVRVEYATNATTTWLPWIGGRASSQSRTDWEPLSVGEQCLIFSESGELSAGVVLPAMLDSQSPPPSTSADEHVTKYADGTVIMYSRATHELSVTVNGGDINIKTTANVNVNATNIKLNNGANVVTTAHICQFTGNAHEDGSSTVFAGE